MYLESEFFSVDIFQRRNVSHSEIITLNVPKNYKSVGRKEVPIIRYIFTILNTTLEHEKC